jgi:hypothetical protein
LISQLLISFLSSGDKPIITTGPRVSYIDVKVGIPCVLLTFEMSIFSIMHIFAFPWKPYTLKNQDDPNAYYKGGFLGFRAIVDCFNPWDIIKASARGFRWLFVGARKRHEDPSYKLETATFDPKGNKDDALPAFKLRSDDDYSSDDPTRIESSLNPTSASTRPQTATEDDDDRATLLKHKQPAATTLPGQALGHPSSQQFGLAAPYPYSRDEDMTSGGYKTVPLHSPSLKPQETDLPYPSDSPFYPMVMQPEMPMPTAISTDTREGDRYGGAGARDLEPQTQGTLPSPREGQRQGVWPHPRSPQASSLRLQESQRQQALQQRQQQQQQQQQHPLSPRSPQDERWRSGNATAF